MTARGAALLAAVLLAPASALAADAGTGIGSGIDWRRAISLADYNTRVVLAGTGLLGAACGVAGSFLVLRKRALLSDAISHATLPGIVLAFMAATLLGLDGRSLPILLAGAAATGLLGMAFITLITRTTKLKDDAALAIVLGVFFGIGVALLSMAGRMPGAQAAGLMGFIYGKTASMLLADAVLIGASGIVACAACGLLFKEFALLCFDEPFARSLGWPALRLDALLMAVIVLVTVVGLQAVGLILVVALLVIPPSAARFWTDSLGRMVGVAAAVGAASALVGAWTSALAPRLPSGAIIVLVAAGAFLLSFLFGAARGVVPSAFRHRRLARRVERHHLLRAFYEILEDSQPIDAAVPAQRLRRHLRWTRRRVARALRRARRLDLVETTGSRAWHLTPEGVDLARRAVRNHRLWEVYLIEFADIAPSHVDRDADAIEHVLSPAMVRRLEQLMAGEDGAPPPSPHAVAGEAAP